MKFHEYVPYGLGSYEPGTNSQHNTTWMLGKRGGGGGGGIVKKKPEVDRAVFLVYDTLSQHDLAIREFYE